MIDLEPLSFFNRSCICISCRARVNFASRSATWPSLSSSNSLKNCLIAFCNSLSATYSALQVTAPLMCSIVALVMHSISLTNMECQPLHALTWLLQAWSPGSLMLLVPCSTFDFIDLHATPGVQWGDRWHWFLFYESLCIISVSHLKSNLPFKYSKHIHCIWWKSHQAPI